MRALIAEDVRRLLPALAKSTITVTVLATAALVIDPKGTGLVSGLIIGLLFMHPIFLAVQLAKDKLDGTLEFLCSLPVAPETLAAVRVALIGAVALLSGVACAVLALWRDVSATTGYPVFVVLLGALLLGALLPSVVATVVLALGARFRFDTLMTVPMLLLFALAALGKLLSRSMSPADAAELVASFRAPGMLAGAVGALATGLVLLLWFAYRVTTKALANFTPESRGS